MGDLAAYLSARKAVIAARQGFFEAIRSQLHPAQRPDAELLGDHLATAPARNIEDDDWVVNPVRGYLTVMAAPSRGRPFRLCVLQQGLELRVGVRFSEETAAERPQIETSLSQIFQAKTPLVRRSSKELLLDWHFELGVYQSALHFEDAVYKVGAVFEASLQALAFWPAPRNQET